MNSEELKAYEAAVDNCEVLRARLAKYEDADGKALVVVVPDCEDLAWAALKAATDQLDRRAAPHAWMSESWAAGSKVITDNRAMLSAAPKPADHNEDVRGMVEALKFARTVMAVIARSEKLSAVAQRSLLAEVNRADTALLDYAASTKGAE